MSATPAIIFAPQGVQANAKTPTVQEWNFTIEQELDKSTVLRLAYVGSHGYHGLLSIDPNTIPASVCSNANGCTAGGTPGTTRSTVPQGAQYIPVGTRPNPYLGAGFFWYTEGNTSYNALQVDVTRRLTQGLQFRANYTWSKNLDMNSGLTGAQANNQAQMIMDRNDLRRDWGLAALNITNQTSISSHYELPFGQGKRWLNNAGGVGSKLIGGWQLNGIATLLSGFPFTPQVGSNRSGDGDTRNPDRPLLNRSFTGPVILGARMNGLIRMLSLCLPRHLWNSGPASSGRGWRTWTCRSLRIRSSRKELRSSFEQSSSTRSIERISGRPTLACSPAAQLVHRRD